MNWIIKASCFDDIYEINLLYNSLKNNQNVIYYTTSNVDNVMYKLIVRHSQELDDSLHICMKDIIVQNQDCAEKYNTILTDFNSKYINNFFIIDNEFSSFQNPTTLYSRLFEINSYFNKCTSRDTDLVIVSNIENMKLEYHNKIVKRPSAIIEKYMDFFIHNSNNFIGFASEIPIIITTHHLPYFSEEYKSFKDRFQLNIATYANSIIELVENRELKDNNCANMRLVTYNNITYEKSDFSIVRFNIDKVIVEENDDEEKRNTRK